MTTKNEIRGWLTIDVTPIGQERCTHMLVVCDTFSWEDYPVYVNEDEDVKEVCDKFNKDMQTVMEVYSFNHDIEEQLNERRAFHYD